MAGKQKADTESAYKGTSTEGEYQGRLSNLIGMVRASDVSAAARIEEQLKAAGDPKEAEPTGADA